jgi:tetratricopeptide (TPR) repeat protein
VALDTGLLDAIRSGRAVLFMGAGAARGAAKPDGGNIPDAPALAERIIKQFLDPNYAGLDFRSAYDLAASSRSVRELQTFLHTELIEYQPAGFHLKLPTFVWAGLVTTNYDLVIERAYEKCEDPTQELITFCQDRDGSTDRLGTGKLLYVKLHGCITHYQEVNPPLISSTEQIINHREGRAGQFAQFLEWAKTKTIIFAGYSFADHNLRTLMEEIRKDGDNRPRHYIIRPDVKPLEIAYWTDRRIQPISMTFADFLAELDREIPSDRRRLALLPAAFSATPFTRFIARSGVTESDSLRNYLESRCQHVSKETVVGSGDPKRFYNGFNLGWYPVANNLDVSRRITKAILEEQVITAQSIAATHLIVVKAHAGAGKSVVLRRLAWDAAHISDALAFFIDDASAIHLDTFEEIVSITKQTIYLFIDDLAEAPDEVARLIRRGRSQRWPLVVVGGARFNEWNVRCDSLEPLVDMEYEISYLSHSEIDNLLGKLEQHKCLGHLETLNFEQRQKALRETYGRQLLVVLHETTNNASFREIIRDEFNKIVPSEAQILYLDICALHRLGPPVRAGLIARVHGIDFEEFRKRFFDPLDHVVELKWDPMIQDWVYRARHSYIAEIVYTEILGSVDEKFDNIMRIVSKLSPAYSYDQSVLGELIRAATLATVFRDRTKGDAVYEAVLASIGRTSHILHQRGLYEMRLAGDASSLDRAERYLNEALELAPNNRAIQHSLAELSLARSEKVRDEFEREAWRRQAEAQANKLITGANTAYPRHTLAKAAIAAVRDSLERSERLDDELSQEALSQAIKHAEDVLRDGLQRFPNDSHLLTEEAALGEILQNADRALRALERAFDSNQQSELIARRLSRVLRAKGRLNDAINILQRGLERNQGSQTLHYDLAQAIRQNSPDADTTQSDSLLFHFQRSFTPGDRNYEAQFWYARQLCLAGKADQAARFFSVLRQLQLPYRQKHTVRDVVQDKDRVPLTFYGQINQRKPTFGFVRADRDSLESYFSVDPEKEGSDALVVGQRVSYNVGFTLFGPAALNVSPLLL